MTILRTALAFERDFVQIPNTWMRDVNLSRRARGLLAEIMTHTQGWEITLESLVDGGPEGRDAIRVGITELLKAGYLVRDLRTRNDAGQLGGTNYRLCDPQERKEPTSEKPTLDIPTLAEPPLKKTKPSEDHLEKKTRATVLKHGWQPSEGLVLWAKEKYPTIDSAYETDKFRDYHSAKGSAFKDWDAAWRNWMRNANAYQANTRTSSSGSRTVTEQTRATWGW